MLVTYRCHLGEIILRHPLFAGFPIRINAGGISKTFWSPLAPFGKETRAYILVVPGVGWRKKGTVLYDLP